MSISSPYVAPGVSVAQAPISNTSTTIASAANICLVGAPSVNYPISGTPTYSQSAITVTDTFVFGTGQTAVALPTLANLNNNAILISVTSITNTLYPGTPSSTGYVQGTDFSVQTGQAAPGGTYGTITPLIGGAFWTSGTTYIPTLVSVTYTYVPSDYWTPVRMFDMASVQARFGPVWATTTSNGYTVYTGVGSPLSLAAQLAFQNGAQSVICQPLFQLVSNVPTVPTEAQLATATPWTNTLQSLRKYSNIDLLVPVIGADAYSINNSAILSVFQAVQSHIAYQNSQNLEIMAILGEDGTANSTQFNTTIPPTSIMRTHASSLQSAYGNALSQQMVLLNNTVFQIALPGYQGGVINVGGQYAAAAFAGALSSRSVSQTMTRQYITGFVGMTDPRLPSDKNADAQAGLLVLENYNGGIRCRHGITLDIQNGPANNEISVVRAKIQVMESVQQTLDNSIIGQIIADANSPVIVESAITAVLTALQKAETIVSFNNVTAAISSTNPTTIIASFTYAPAFPVNYIQATFSLDLSNGTITSSTTPTVS